MSGKRLGEFAFSDILSSLAAPGFESALSKQHSADDKCPQTLPGTKKSFGKSLGVLFYFALILRIAEAAALNRTERQSKAKSLYYYNTVV